MQAMSDWGNARVRIDKGIVAEILRKSLSFRGSTRALCCLFLGLSLCATTMRAQQPAGAGSGSQSLPDSPQPKQQGAVNPPENTPERFVGYMTNRSIFFPDIAHSAGPLSTVGKLKLFVDESISPAYILESAVSAAYNQSRNTPKGYGQGWNAYGKRFGESMARDSSSAFFGDFALASALHQDPRFFPQSHPTLWGSVKYSAQRIFVTRTDLGRETFNSSGLLGTAMAEALANAYLPQAEMTAGKTFHRVGIDLAWKVAGNMFKNYWPTFFHDLGLNRLKVIPNPGQPN
jgi:hypothetical protein